MGMNACREVYFDQVTWPVAPVALLVERRGTLQSGNRGNRVSAGKFDRRPAVAGSKQSK